MTPGVPGRPKFDSRKGTIPFTRSRNAYSLFSLEEFYNFQNDFQTTFPFTSFCGHPDDEQLTSRFMKAYFLPPNLTSLIEPFDQGVLEKKLEKEAVGTVYWKS